MARLGIPGRVSSIMKRTHDLGDNALNDKQFSKYLDRLSSMNVQQQLAVQQRIEQLLQERPANVTENGQSVAALDHLRVKPAERKRLKQAARRNKIVSGYYDEWKIAHVVEETIQLRDKMWGNVLQDYSEAGFHMGQAMSHMASVGDYIARTPGRLYRMDDNRGRIYPFSTAMIGDLMESSSIIATLMQRYETPHDAYMPMVQLAVATADALRKLINGQDDGEAIRALAPKLSLDHDRIKPWREMVKSAGRTKGDRTAANKYVSEVVAGHVEELGRSWREIGVKMWEDLHAMTKRTSVQNEVYSILSAYQTPEGEWSSDGKRRLADYIRKNYARKS